MKIIDPEHWIFTLTAIAIGAVFVLLTPSTTIIARWYPGKTDWLWLYPTVLFCSSFFLWLVYRVKLPRLIERGIFEDRRRMRLVSEDNKVLRAWRWLRPMVRLLMRVFLIAAVCSAGLIFLRSGKIQALLVNLP